MLLYFVGVVLCYSWVISNGWSTKMECIETFIMTRACQNTVSCPSNINFTTFCELDRRPSQNTSTSNSISTSFTKCPGEIMDVTLHPNVTERLVTWSAIEAQDENGTRLNIKQIYGKQNGSLFEKGWHENVFRAHTPSNVHRDAFCVVKFEVKVLECQRLDDPANGKVSCSEQNKVGSVCKFTCDTGTEISGLATLQCQTNGLYSSSVPVCKTVSCKPLVTPENGQFVCSDGNQFGSWCNMECDDSYIPSPSSITNCDKNKQWNPDPATFKCLDICVPIPRNCPKNITVYASDISTPINVTWDALVVTDNSNGEVYVHQTAGIASGGRFPVGVTSVALNMKDKSGNDAVCTFDVVVTDNNSSTGKSIFYASHLEMLKINGTVYCKGMQADFLSSDSTMILPHILSWSENLTVSFSLQFSTEHGSGGIFSIQADSESDFDLLYTSNGNFIAIYKGHHLQRNGSVSLATWNTLHYTFDIVLVEGKRYVMIQGIVNNHVLHYAKWHIFKDSANFQIFKKGYVPKFLKNNKGLRICNFQILGRDGNGNQVSVLSPVNEVFLNEVSVIDTNTEKTADKCSTTKVLPTSNDATATCSYGYSGEDCDIPPSPCINNLCQSHGECKVIDTHKYQCSCGPGYSGKFCHFFDVNGGWGHWFHWSSCSARCYGRKMRHRNCNNPAPRYDGKICSAPSTEEINCQAVDNCSLCPTLNLLYGTQQSCRWENGEIQCLITCSFGKVGLRKMSKLEVKCGASSGFQWVTSTGRRITITDLPICSDASCPLSIYIKGNITSSGIQCTDIKQRKCMENCTLTISCQEMKSGTISIYIQVLFASTGLLNLTDYIKNNNVSPTLSALVQGFLAIETTTNDILVRSKGKLKRPLDTEQRKRRSAYTLNIKIEAGVKCPNGSISKDGICGVCPQSTRQYLNECIFCDTGRYQDKPGQTTCKLCPHGTTSHVGSSTIKNCTVHHRQRAVDDGTSIFIQYVLPSLIALLGVIVGALAKVLFTRWCSKKDPKEKYIDVGTPSESSKGNNDRPTTTDTDC